MGQVARDALFLNRFKEVQLPYADIAIAALVGFVVALYIRASRRIGLKNLVIICLLLFGSNAFVFWWAAHYSSWPWLFPILYIWVGIFGVLATTQVWTLANFVWTTREAKRLFSLLGSGGILGGIFGGFFSNFVAKHFGTESLLIVVGVFLLLSAGLVEFIWRQARPYLAESTEPEVPEDTPKPALSQSFRLIRESHLLQIIAVLICLSSIVTTAAGWQLKAIAKETLSQKDALAAFFGSFYGYTGVLSLTAQLFLTSKILKRFGVGVALFVLPLSLVAGSVGVLLSGSLLAATLLKGSDKVLRYSVDTSAMQLLYLPIPAKIKFQAKSFIDTVVWRLGDGLAGLTLLLFATTLHFSARQIGWVSLVLLVVWMSLAFFARGEYIATLRSNIQQLRLDPIANSAPILDASTTNVLVARFNSKDPSEVLYALSLFEMGLHQSHAAVRNLLDHPSSEVRKKAIAVLNAGRDKSARPLVAPLLKDEDLEVRTEALLYMAQHAAIDPLAHIQELGDYADYSIRSATVAFFSGDGENQNLEAARLILDAMVREEGLPGRQTRLEAARLIATLPDRYEVQLNRLLQDSDDEIVQYAIRAVGKLGKRRSVPFLIEHLGNPTLRVDAIDALLVFEESIAGALRDYLNDRSVSIDVRREIPPVLLRLGTPDAVRILADNLLQPDNILRFRIIHSLNKLREHHKNVSVDSGLVETVMVGEIMGHYRSYQILASSKGAPTEDLKQSMKEEVERIFRLMKLLSPNQDLESAYLGLHSKDPVMHANALEFLDNTLKPQLRNLVVPLIDGDISDQERAHLADRFLRVKVQSQEEAIAALMSTEDPWLQSCAALWLANPTENAG